MSAVLVAAAVRFALRPLDSIAALAKTVSQATVAIGWRRPRTDTELGQTAHSTRCWMSSRVRRLALNKLRSALGPFLPTRRMSCEPRSRGCRPRPRRCCITMISLIMMSASICKHCWFGRRARRCLISDLLTAARLDAGIDLDVAPVSLWTLANSEIDRVRLLHPETVVTMTGPEVIARADAAKVSASAQRDRQRGACGRSGGEVHLVLREHEQRDRRDLGLGARSTAVAARTDLRAPGST